MATTDRKDKTMSMKAAVAAFVHDGGTVCLEGFTHLVPTAAGHEIIRQGRRDLTVVRMTADIVVDQMIAAGCVSRLVSSFVGNSSAGSLGELRRRIESADPAPLAFEEYSHYGMICRYPAGAQRLPFHPLRSYGGSDLPSVNSDLRKVTSPYPGPDGEAEQIYVVPPVNPDVAIIHAQRADRSGNTQMWGLTGIQAEAVHAADKAVVVAEEIVDDEAIRSDPNRTLVPAHAVDAVVVCTRGHRLGPAGRRRGRDRTAADRGRTAAAARGRGPGPRLSSLRRITCHIPRGPQPPCVSGSSAPGPWAAASPSGRRPPDTPSSCATYGRRR